MELISQKMRTLAPEMDPLRLGTGWKPEDLAKPQIMVESTFGDSHPGSGHLDKLVAAACQGIAEVGGHGARYFCTDICDGESQGTDGINFSLSSREMIANMIEIHGNATPFDGAVYIASCDKGMPANLMGLARVNTPAVVVTGGTMAAGPELLTLEQLGMYSAKYERGEIDEAKLNWAKQNACPSCGACSFIGTASTMQIMAEALGLTLPGSALLPATSPDLEDYARRAGRQAVALARQGLRPSDIVTMDSFENAILVHAAISGSTNALLHLPAIAHEFGIAIDGDTFDRLHRGAKYLLDGKWITHQAYGEQFAAESFERHLPETARGIADYLGSGIIKGIGPRLASKIAETFGEETFEILENDPLRLSEIRGITPQKARSIGRQFTEMSEMRLLMDFLTENGLPVWLTPRLYKRLGVAAMDALAENPYLLCDEYYEIDFSLADGLALNLGLSRLSEERTDAGVLYTMTFNLSNGHTFIPIEKLVAASCSLLSDDEVEMDEQRVLRSIDRLEMRAMVVREQIAGRDAVYLRQMYEAEDFLAGFLKDLALKHYDYEFDLEELVDVLAQDADVEYAPLQRKAIIQAAKCGVSILTGGPGTGKTTTVRGMLRVFESLGLEVVLAAPTGRAAKRLSELCGMEAKTIHRLLEAGYGQGGKLSFQRGLTNPLDCDVVVLDEVSMVDIALMQALLAAMPNNARLVLVGDSDQLPPVGPGNFLRDMILSGKVPVIQLTEIFRQAQQSDIVMNAHAINKGQDPVPSGKDGDFFIMRKTDPSTVIQTVTQLCKERLPNYYGLNPSQIQVLSPSRRQGAGTMQLNRSLQEALNPPTTEKQEKRFGDIIFREGDRVMQIRNNYDIIWERVDNHDQGTGMFNGDVGEILQIFPSQECMIVKFDDKIATYTFDMLDELELAYAMTVHKAQGSEFDAVIVALSGGISKRLLTRNILYTAITRAKKLLVIVGSQDTIDTMVHTNTRGRRYSALKARMNAQEG